MNAQNLTMQKVYVSVEVNGEQVTFHRLIELLREGVARTDKKGKLGARRPDDERIPAEEEA